MDATAVLEAKASGDLAPILEVLRDQEFLYANLHHDAQARTLALSVQRKFPPRKGNWVLEARGVGGKTIRRQANSASETLKDITYDPEKGEVVLHCVLDEIRLSVDSLDLRATYFDPEAGKKKLRFEDLPESFRKEVQQQRDAEESERLRLRAMRRSLWIKGAVGGGALALFLGALQAIAAEGRLWVDFLLLPAMGFGTMYACLRTRRDRLSASLYNGLPGMFGLMAGLTVINQGSLMIVFCGGLILIAGPQVIVLWIRGEEADLD